MYEDEFIEWFATVESDCAEARAEVDDLYERLLNRLCIDDEDPHTELLKKYLYTDYMPI